MMELPQPNEWGWKSSSLYAVAVPRVAVLTASVRKLPSPVQLCASVLVLVRSTFIVYTFAYLSYDFLNICLALSLMAMMLIMINLAPQTLAL